MRRQWKWSAWYAATVTAHNKALSAPPTANPEVMFRRRQRKYAHWLQQVRGLSQHESLKLAQAMGRSGDPLSAEACAVDDLEPEIATIPDCRPIKIRGITITPRWRWTLEHKRYVLAQFAALERYNRLARR